MNFKNISKLGKNLLNISKLSASLLKYWNNHSSFIFSAFSFFLIFLGIYVWYINEFKSDWSAEMKDQYKKTQSKDINFKEKEFKSVMEEMGRKEIRYNEKFDTEKNVFRMYPKEIPETPKAETQNQNNDENKNPLLQ